MHDFEMICNAKFDTIQSQIKRIMDNASEDGGEPYELYGARMIQSHRCEIKLNFTSLSEEHCNFWNQFCDQFHYKSIHMENILNVATTITKLDLGENFHNGSIQTPSLILCKTKNDQTFHLDIMNKEKQKQYSMMLSHGSISTTVYNTKEQAHVNSSDEKIDENDKVRNDFKDIWKKIDDEIEGGLNEKFKTNIHTFETTYQETFHKKSKTYSKIKSGFGELFKISSPRSTSNNESFWEKKRIRNIPVGSVMALQGNVIHAGSGTNDEDDIRIILFWTWSDKTVRKYNEDIQETKLSIIMEIAREFFETFNDIESRKEMLRIVKHCYDTSDDAYKDTCINTFSNYSNIRKMLSSWKDDVKNTNFKRWANPNKNLFK